VIPASVVGGGDKYIEQCRVSINGQDAHKGNRVQEGDDVRVDGELLKRKNKLFSCPEQTKGVTCTTDVKDQTNIIDFVNFKGTRIFPIGRLDKRQKV